MPGFTLNLWPLTLGGSFVLTYNPTVFSQSTLTLILQDVCLLFPPPMCTPPPPCSLSAGDLASQWIKHWCEYPQLQISQHQHMCALRLFLLGWLNCLCFCLSPTPPCVHWPPFFHSFILPLSISYRQHCPHFWIFSISIYTLTWCYFSHIKNTVFWPPVYPWLYLISFMPLLLFRIQLSKSLMHFISSVLRYSHALLNALQWCKAPPPPPPNPLFPAIPQLLNPGLNSQSLFYLTYYQHLI